MALMKVEWNPEDGSYQSIITNHIDAWVIYHALKDEYEAVGIESISDWEHQEYLRSQIKEVAE